MAADIERRIGFGQAAALGGGQDVTEFRTALGHRAQNVVASAVDDSIHGQMAIRSQRFTQDPDNRDSAANTGFKTDKPPILSGGLEDAVSMLSQQRLVGSHHVLARFERRKNQASGRFVAAE